MSYVSGGTLKGALRLTTPTTPPGVSASGEGRIYFDGTVFQVSQNGGAYFDLSNPTTAGGWTDDGTVVRLTTVTDGVGIGTAAPAASSKLEVLGDATRLNVSVTGGNPGGATTGGTLTFVAGTGGATGAGGNTVIRGGPGGTTSGVAGSVNVFGGTPTDGNGGVINLIGANGVGTNRNGGQIGLTAGNATGTGTPGVLDMLAGNGGTTAGAMARMMGGQGGTNSAGGVSQIRGGLGNGSGDGGAASVLGGSAGATGVGGAVSVSGGIPTDGNGGAVSVSGSAGVGTNRAGGGVTLTGGNSTGSGAGGVLQLSSGTSPAGTSGSIRFSTGTTGAVTERGRWTPNESLNLGDGTVNAAWGSEGIAGTQINLYGSSAGSTVIRHQTFSAAAASSSPVLALARGRGTPASPTAALSGDTLGVIGIAGLTGTVTQATAANWTATATENFTAGTTGTRLALTVGTTGSGSPTERLSLNGVGTMYLGDGTLAAAFAVEVPIFGLYGYKNSSNLLEWRAFSNTATDGAIVSLRHQRGTAASPAISVDGDLAGGVRWAVADSSASTNNIASIEAFADGAVAAVDTPGRIVFSTMPASASVVVERARIDHGGTLFLGDGTAVAVVSGSFPSQSLTSYRNSSNNAGFYAFSATAGDQTVFNFVRSRGTAAAPSIVSSGDALGLIQFAAFVTASTTRIPATISAVCEGTPSTTSAAGRLVFSTAADGAATPTERARITNAGRVGVATTTPVSTLDTDGSVSSGDIATVSTNTTLDDTHSVVLVDATGGGVTITLPAVSGIARRRYTIKKVDSSGNAVTIDGNGAETIDGQTTETLASQYDTLEIVTNATEWFII